MRALFIPDNLQAGAVKRCLNHPELCLPGLSEGQGVRKQTFPGVPAEHLSLTARQCGIEKG